MTGRTLEFPPGFDRTRPEDREPNNSYEVTLASALDDLEAELERLGVDDYRLETAARQRKRDNRPYANASPDDPGAVVHWTMNGDQFAVACDQHTRLRDNVRTIGLYIREKRKMESRPVETGASEFANARLPPGDSAEGEDPVVATAPRSPAPAAILDLPPDAPDDVVRERFRELVPERHPDHGGSTEAFVELQAAKEAMIDG